MSIIFEGVDGTGKTTDIKQFMLFNYDYAYVHNWAVAKNKVDILSEATKEIFLLNNEDKILFDRSWIITEFVYSTILKRKSPITLAYVDELVKLINRKKHTLKLFYFQNPTKLIHANEEDAKLPFCELNKLYLALFTARFNVDNFIIECIDTREQIQ